MISTRSDAPPHPRSSKIGRNHSTSSSTSSPLSMLLTLLVVLGLVGQVQAMTANEWRRRSIYQVSLLCQKGQEGTEVEGGREEGVELKLKLFPSLPLTSSPSPSIHLRARAQSRYIHSRSISSLRERTRPRSKRGRAAAAVQNQTLISRSPAPNTPRSFAKRSTDSEFLPRS